MGKIKLCIRTISVFVVIWICSTNFMFSQNIAIEKIKADGENYIWGEGFGTTLKKADQEALSMLVSQISTYVESSFVLLKKEMLINGGEGSFKETCNSVVKTYSNTTLKNTRRIVYGNEPKARVFRYIKQSEVEKIFLEREEKIKGFVLNADIAFKNNQIADALRYYYWALNLLKSHPEGDKIKYLDRNQNSHLLATWIPLRINNIFVDINITILKIEKKKDEVLYTLNINHNNRPVKNFDYSYWTGTDYSNLCSSRDGVGFIELFGMAADMNELELKAEYIFEGEARIDKELESVLNRIDPIPFRNSYYKIPITNSPKDIESNPTREKSDCVFSGVIDESPYRRSIEKVIKSIKEQNYLFAHSEFTSKGLDFYKKIIAYGKARVIGNYQLRFIVDREQVICRALPMCFDFESNNKRFVEKVVFHFNKDVKIESLSFSLSSQALGDILNKNLWEEKERMILINFLEHYKTAFALKRLDYIERIFSDDALIITGEIVKAKYNESYKYADSQIIKYNRQTKQQYLKSLRYSFLSKEFINVKFENNEIRKAGKGGSIFGIKIKQNYYSSNYGDVGYLFLIVDLNNCYEPIIHVRTWQPNATSNDNLYDLSSFN
ncbi:MAG: LPP20 family lipoprotein [Labilibaculum sp.]|nr:LPP20 family lipoprotein [Labilibaculum sp.]